MYWNTVSPILTKGLKALMQAPELSAFRLVGGTALSLHLGHRMSVDIDLFTDAEYDSIDFTAIELFLETHFGYVRSNAIELIGMGRSYVIGQTLHESLKLDIYYTDPFIETPFVKDGVRMATISEITAMKLDVISRGGRKKDFWDIHEITEHLSIEEMLTLHERRYPYHDHRDHTIKQLTNFDNADEDLDPICLKGKYWELIKYDIAQAVKQTM